MKINKNSKAFQISFLVLSLLLVSIICSLLLWYKTIFPHKYRLGDRSLYTYTTVKEREVINEKKTQDKINKAKDKILEYYLEHPVIYREASKEQQIDKIFEAYLNDLEQYFTGNISYFEDSKRLTQYQEKYEKYQNSNWKVIKPYIPNIKERLLSYGYIGSLDKDTVVYLLPKQRKFSDKELNLLINVIRNGLQPNIKVDLTKLEEFEKERLANIQPITEIIPAKTNVIKRGEIITHEKYAILKQLKITDQKKFYFNKMQEGVALTLFILSCFVFYIRSEKFRLNNKQVLMLISLLFIASAWTGIFAFNKPAFLPFAAVTMITAFFFNSSVGFAAGLLFTGLSYLALRLGPVLMMPAVVGVLLGTILAKRANNRADIVKVGVWLALAQSLVYLFITVIDINQHFSLALLFQHAMAGVGTGIIVAFGMPFLESIFSVVNRFRLKELSDLEQPLLKDLKEKAPGTFEHTLVVADLAVSAAQKLNLDHELIRVGVLYHDIGKAYDSQIFIENQFGGKNPHKKMTNIESARAIIDHVTVGLEMARKAGLPDPIISFIPEHQGTATAGHFYQKEKAKNPSTDDRDYRYPGPKPQNKESGVVMLADTVEASIRSLKSSDKQLVLDTIHKMIDKRVFDEQLTESGLTNRDLRTIAESFYESWKNKNHERIKYDLD